GCLERDVALPEFVDDVLQVPNAARQPIDPGYHKGVSGPEKVEQNFEFASAATARAARLFGPDHVAAGRLQRAPLQAEASSKDGHSRRSAWRSSSQRVLDRP